MEELKKELSEGYLGIGEYFSKGFELFKLIVRKNILIVGIIMILQGFILSPSYYMNSKPENSTSFLFGVLLLGTIFVILQISFSFFLIKKAVSLVDSTYDRKNNFIKNIKKAILMIIIFYLPIAGILIIIYLVIFPYTSISYVIEDIPLKELYHYNLKITPKNRMKIYLPVIILNLISYICTNILSKFLPFIIDFVFSTISSTLIVIFLMITGSIIYLNVKYIRLEDENDKSQNNDNNDELKIIE